MEKKYDKRQLGKFNRRDCGVRPFKILKVEEKGNEWEITFRLPEYVCNGSLATFPLSAKFDRKQHIAGNYVDLILKYTLYGGKCSSYTLTYVGITPPEYIPTNGEEIGI